MSRKAPRNHGDARSIDKAYLGTYTQQCRVCGDVCSIASVRSLDRKMLSVWWYCTNPDCEMFYPEEEVE